MATITAQETFDVALTMAARAYPGDLSSQMHIVTGAAIAGMTFFLEEDRFEDAKTLGRLYMAWIESVITPEQKQQMRAASVPMAERAYEDIKKRTAFTD